MSISTRNTNANYRPNFPRQQNVFQSNGPRNFKSEELFNINEGHNDSEPIQDDFEDRLVDYNEDLIEADENDEARKMDLVLFVEFVENEIQKDPPLKLRIMLTSMKINYLLLHIPNYWFFVFFKLHVMKGNLNILQRQLRHNSDSLTTTENTFKGLFRISKELAHWVVHQILPYMRKSKRTTAIPKNLRVVLYNTTNIL
ncbi:hypothetical protein FQA39_LY09778 [Lamprigera yunnana]|nr:hypothetical protein FQA39_LY09778 [Lamprigera yunnana]